MNRRIATGLSSFLLVLTLLAVVALTAVLRLGPVSSAPGDDAADRVFGQGGSFTSNTCNTAGFGSPPTAGTLCVPQGLAVDGASNFFVADSGNDRVLEYDSPLTTDAVADRVFGQPDFTTVAGSPCRPPSGTSLCDVNGLAVDGAGNLYVADSGNNRVLQYDSPLTSDTVADRVFGTGGSFTIDACNFSGPPTAGSLCNPFGVTVDGADNLYISDSGNSRVLWYDTPLTTDTMADRVFGQAGSFTTRTCNLGGISASSLCGNLDVVVDAAENLYVAESQNNRVLEFDSPLSTDTVADRVFGQGGSFTSAICNTSGSGSPPSAGSLCNPRGVAVEGTGKLYVTESQNNRALQYDSPLSTDAVADRVFGQGGSFSTNTCNLGGISATSLCNAQGAELDGVGNLYVGDALNNRLLEYDTPGPAPTPTPCPPEGCPTATATPTRTPTPTATPGPSPTATPTPTVVQRTFQNFTLGVADRLDWEEIDVAAVSLAQNASGCAAPGVSEVGFTVIVVWPQPCVDPGEQVTLNVTCLFAFACPPTPPEFCVKWSVGGTFLGAQGSGCPPGTPTPTATATATPTPPPTREVTIDIKPGGFPNSINLSSSGVIAVAILTTSDFDATTVDASSVCFGDAEAPGERDCSEAHGRGHLQDVDGDGDLDMLLHYETSETGIDAFDTQACLHGQTTDGTPTEGCDSVRIVPPWLDSDGDVWGDAMEADLTTDQFAACSSGPGHSAWPPDFNNDASVTGADLSAVAGVIGGGVPPAPQRRDIAPDPPDGSVTGADLSAVAGRIGTSCSPP